jgi:hypothetical protein
MDFKQGDNMPLIIGIFMYVGLITGLVAMAIGYNFLNAWVISNIYVWFVLPLTHITVSYWVWVGVLLIYSLMNMKTSDYALLSDEETKKKLIEAMKNALFIPITTLGVAWIIKIIFLS